MSINAKIDRIEIRNTKKAGIASFHLKAIRSVRKIELFIIEGTQKARIISIQNENLHQRCADASCWNLA